MPGKVGEMQRAASGFILFEKFKKMNTQSIRQALAEDELAWLENLQPIADNNLAVVPGAGAAIASILETFTSFFYAAIGPVDYIIGFSSAGAGYAINIATGSVNNFAPDGTFSAPDVTTWQASRILIADPTSGYSTFDGTTFVMQGGVSPNIQLLDGGTGYVTAPTFTITGGSGIGASGTTTIQNGSVVSALLTSAGAGFNVNDRLSVVFSGTVVTTTWSPSAALNSNGSGEELFSLRQQATTLTASGSLVRVTFNASSAASFTTANCSIGKCNVATAPNTDSSPIELLFNQQSGFTISAGQTIVSDWLDFAVSAGDKIIVVIDIGSTNGNPRQNASGTETNANAFFKAASSSYNLSIVSGYTSNAGNCFGISLIETATHGGTGTGAAGHVTMTGFPVASLTINNHGQFATPAAGTYALTITGGGGSGASGTATVVVSGKGRTVSSVSLTAPGSGYTSAPSVTLSGVTGASQVPSFTANLGTESVATIVLDAGGSGYGATPPSVSIVGGGTLTPATAHATVSGGAVNALILDSGGSGYTSTPTVVIGGGGANVAVAAAHVWPFLTKPATIAVFQGRVWLGGGQIPQLLQWTGTGASYGFIGYDDFLTQDASGALLLTDADLVHAITVLRNYNNYLYIMGDQSVKQIGNISIGGLANNITLFTILTLSSDQGTIYPRSCISYNRVFLFCNSNGVYAVVGATVQKISDDMDGIFKLVDFSQSPNGAILDLNNIHNAVMLVRYIDPLSTTRSLMLAFNGKQWYALSQSSSLNCIVSTPNLATGQITLYGSSGTDVTPLFTAPATAVPWKAQSSLTHHGNPIQRKKIIRGGFSAQAAAPANITMTLDTENGSIGYTMALAAAFQLYGGTLDSLGAQFGGAGQYLGMTLSGTLPVGFVLTNELIEFQETALWK